MFWEVWRRTTSRKVVVVHVRRTNACERVWKSRPRTSLRKPFAKPGGAIRKDTSDGSRWWTATKRNWISCASGFTKKAITRWIILDFIHVAERVWKAGLDFHKE